MGFVNKILNKSASLSPSATRIVANDEPANLARRQRRAEIKALANTLHGKVVIAMGRIDHHLANAKSPEALRKLHSHYGALKVRLNEIIHARDSDHVLHLDETLPEHIHHDESELHPHLSEFNQITRDYQQLIHERTDLPPFMNARTALGGTTPYASSHLERAIANENRKAFQR